MYVHSGHPYPISRPSTVHQRRPDLDLIKSPHWSHSSSFEQPYPSPPMSETPTSPRRSALYPEASSSAGYPSSFAPSQPRPPYPPPPPIGAMEGPMLATPPAGYQPQPSYGPDPRGYYAPPQRPELHPRPITAQLPYPPQAYESYLPPGQAPMPLVPSSHHSMPASVIYQQGPTSLSTSSAPRAQRTTRRTKAHVAKACQNCKKAHLSCDEARPCARCVASGKQATCVDVEHKKRGRPRLRDDREQRLEQAAAAAVAAAQVGGPAMASPARGHRRGESLRVLRSQAYGSGSDDSRPSTSQGMAAPRSYGPTSAGGVYPIARSTSAPLSAFLNLDLQILKASEPLRALLNDPYSLIDRPLSEFVTTQYEGALQRIQNELRDERARREPTYLPAIYPEQQERAAVRDHDPENAESLSGDFLDRQDLYTFRLAGGRQTEQFQVRIRLARTSTFFATMILYRLQPPPPAIVPSPYARGSPYGFGDPSSPAQSAYNVSNPGSPFSTMQTALMTTLPPPSSIPPSYIYAPPHTPEQGFMSRTAPGMYPPPPMAGQYVSTPSAALGQGHRSAPMEPVQLPPIVSSAPTTPMSHFVETGMPTQTPAGSSSRHRTPGRNTDDGSEEDTRKRRRLNIRDIVEK